MPHITIEYSQNLAGKIDAVALVDVLHEAARATEAFPIGGIRTFARPSVASRAGDGSDANNFIQIHVRIAPGRSKELKQAIAKALFDAAESELSAIFASGPTGLQLELSEFDRDFTVSRNTMINPAA